MLLLMICQTLIVVIAHKQIKLIPIISTAMKRLVVCNMLDCPKPRVLDGWVALGGEKE